MGIEYAGMIFSLLIDDILLEFDDLIASCDKR